MRRVCVSGGRLVWRAWQIVVLVSPCFPTVVAGLTPLTMTYTSAVVFALVVNFGLNWIFYARKKYNKPLSFRGDEDMVVVHS